MSRVLRGLVRTVARVLEAGENALVDVGNPPPKMPEPPVTTRWTA